MLDHLHSLVPSHEPDCLQAALADWFTLGLHTGLRSSEYCQTSTNSRTGCFKTNLDGDPTAFLYRDFRFYHHDRKEIPLSQALHQPPETITTIAITWRRQKNSQVDADCKSGPERHCTPPLPCSSHPPHHQPRIPTHIPHHYPLGIYSDPNHPRLIRFFSDLQIREQLRELAVSVHHVSDPHDLAKYTTHSVRVGACVIPFLVNVIKFCLRWQGESWREYLRHLPALAAQQVRAINNTGVYDATQPTNTLPTIL
jgi:hypothetical protein